jgi:hypothetical protein
MAHIQQARVHGRLAHGRTLKVLAIVRSPSKAMMDTDGYFSNEMSVSIRPGSWATRSLMCLLWPHALLREFVLSRRNTARDRLMLITLAQSYS